jgi:ribosomal protein S18 acetylase RimI-like enzyme
MATAAARRGTGIGTALTEAAADVIASRGGRLIWCDARESAVSFYARLGFVGTGESYAHPETGAPHLMMYRELSGGPRTSAQ